MGEKWPYLLTTEQACEYLSIGVSTFKSLRAAGKIKSVKIGDGGKLVRFRRSDLDRFIDELPEGKGEPVTAGAN